MKKLLWGVHCVSVAGGLSINFKSINQITLISEGTIPHKSNLDTTIWIAYIFMSTYTSYSVHCILLTAGVRHGFEVMTESVPKHPLQLIYLKFPGMSIVDKYDNTCHAIQYSLNHNPGFFSSCHLVSDRLRWPNHKHCSSGHNMNSYVTLQG